MKKIIITILLFTMIAYSMDNDDPLIMKTSIHALEYRVSDNEKVTFLDGEIALGYDLSKVYLRAHIEQNGEELETGVVRGIYSFATHPYWDAELGIRKDFEENGKEYLSLGLKGLYPYYIGTEAVLFVAENGLVQAQLALEHEIMITQRLMLMLGSEISVFSQDDEDIEVGSGLSSSELSFKVMYAITKKIIPYIGIHSENKYFNNREMSEDEEKDILSYTIGIHAWF